MSDKYDVLVIGGGPAGYVAAIRAAQLGMQVACIDKWLDPDDKPSLGGTCLNVGCIPSKALLESSEIFHRAQHEYAEHGVEIGDLGIDVPRMQKRKAKITGELTGGIASLFKANGIEWLQGHGQVQDSGKVAFKPHKGGKKQTLEADNIVIASGSEPVALDIAPFDGEYIVDSSGALAFDEVPGRLGIIGAGYIGVELGSVWSRLGSETVLLEAVEDFLPIADRQIAREALKQFRKQDLDIRLGARVLSAKTKGRGKNKTVVVEYEEGQDKQTAEFDRLIVAVGRRPCTDGLLASGARVELDDKGFISVNDAFRTSLPGVYAIGDVIGGPMLAHKGMEEGSVLAEILAGQKPHINYLTVPSVVYTAPEIAWVGKTEEQVKSEGTPYRTGTIPFAANGRAKALGQQAGMVKLIAHEETDEILGAHMLGPFVSELIQEMVVAMEFRASSEDIARIIHGHPTLSETVHEAALAVDERPIHVAMRRRRKAKS
ncbi:dihydrolipoyl dehydrogenase [Salinisphaera sp. PC39]|uniref:dihydrolipoyl dehydrogenase n=1 Tax=Salinisphaera sp. PC39 TaxID=1304156 RepID=UPI00333EC0E5